MRKFVVCLMLLLPIFTGLLMYSGFRLISVKESNGYNVTFYDWDETVYSKQKVQSASEIVIPTPPVKEDYEFVRWDVVVNETNKTILYYALYEPTE